MCTSPGSTHAPQQASDDPQVGKAAEDQPGHFHVGGGHAALFRRLGAATYRGQAAECPGPATNVGASQ
jgi:hypothetical protein